MAQKIARVNWNRGQYSKEYTAVIGCYPVEQDIQSDNQQSELAPQRDKAKRKVASAFSCLRL